MDAAARPDGDLAIVGIGASAGGLEAVRNLLRVLPAKTGAAFVLVLHLEPNHASLMVDLLGGHTSMTVVQATEGMPIAAEHLYVIAPGRHLAVAGGCLHLSEPLERHGARLPFDFLLHSLASACGSRAACIVLSGSGSDGSLGLVSIHEAGGLVLVQDPAEAGWDGMPRAAIATGLVDQIAGLAAIPAALADHIHGSGAAREPVVLPPSVQARLPEIVALLRTRTAHDFTLYKTGTLRRRIERRMGVGGLRSGDVYRYLERLRSDDGELDLLAKDLLINVTRFFRDPEVFAAVAERVVPALVRDRVAGHPLRIWIAGCSTGEEAYSLAMLFLEQDGATLHKLELQVFASDVDADAVATAREGFYPETIVADVSPERLTRFFVKVAHGYRVSPELRAAVVFTVQDVLIDPPFSRLDMISCRNLLIYLGPEAQTKVVALFHFALRDGGILLLGNAETIAAGDGSFEVTSKAERLYRRTGRSRAGGVAFALPPPDSGRGPPRREPDQLQGRRMALADLCRRQVMETYAPAAVLINRKHECLYSLGPTDRYLRVPPGYPSHDLVAMMPQNLRSRFEAAVVQALREAAPVVVGGGRRDEAGVERTFSIELQPLAYEGETLLLVCFLDALRDAARPASAIPAEDLPRVAELERDLEATRKDLGDAVRNLELSSEEQKAINEEALSINEEYQSSNEELLTSKEELQSLNEELTALNSQLQETLERQRTTSNDLQNVLYSTDVATIFLDLDLAIRFFTPATKSLFAVIPGDVGRPLADLHSLSADAALASDAARVLRALTPIEREIETRSGVWFLRRVLPYRTLDDQVAGVVITFVDITQRKHNAEALEAAKRQADLANVAKSRFLAAASHDLRQPLQTLCLLQGLLAQTVEGEKAVRLVTRLDETLAAMTGMINTLLDMNQIEAGTVQAEVVAFPIDRLLDRLRDEFTYHAQAKGLVLKVVGCRRVIASDPRLLEQMLRNLIANAIKYTPKGKVLVGCRHRRDGLVIEVHDSGIGIADDQIEAIFEEYHQVDNTAREHSRGLGLGLSIVRRLGELLGHAVTVHSHPGRGSTFALSIARSPHDVAVMRPPARHPSLVDTAAAPPRAGGVLIVEDDPEVRELLVQLFEGRGHHVAAGADGPTALALVAGGTIHPDLLLADFNLPRGMNGLQVAAALREMLGRRLPVIVLTGDISTATLRDIALHDCIHIDKPVRLPELLAIVDRVLGAAAASHAAVVPRPAITAASGRPAPTVWVVDDDDGVRTALRDVLEAEGVTVRDFASCEAFLAAHRPSAESCLLIDAYLPGMSGLELLARLREDGRNLPSIMITGNSDVPMAVAAMKAGASDFIEKPIGRGELLASVERALDQARDIGKLAAWRSFAADHVAVLTPRQHQIMNLVLAGHPSKNIAADLGISQRTVENHRASIMRKTGTKSLPALARLALAAGDGEAD
ncbi:chemotaxis protein CheB [Siculibacillus lacustris]|uniref:chemotaxis protein CheB n=1 Tax=Siculibacillus lacustris TaxID=1549641 RepID=UPI001D198624|nr:chemotaxis protein CheB [Siculibacillus lacustris]